PIAGVGNDVHSLLPPITPPVPPSPAPIPAASWIVAITSPAAGFVITGKWSWYQVTTEGVGNIHAGHDWGFGQAHIPIPPTLASPSIAIRVIASQIKYFLPSSPNTEAQDGSPPGIRGPTGPVAVATPAFVTVVQDCQDINSWGFVAPTGFCFQQVSTREVGFTLGDLVAGVISMAADAAAALVSRAIGGPPATGAGAAAENIASAVVGTTVGAVVNLAVALLPPGDSDEDKNTRTVMKVLLGAAGGLGSGGASGGASGLASGLIGAGGDWAGGAAQQAIDGPRQRDDAAMQHGGTPLFD
ncbi:MAG: hypothetical protein PVJ02_17965, partial [Gemmatimonadota bacterium]